MIVDYVTGRRSWVSVMATATDVPPPQLDPERYETVSGVPVLDPNSLPAAGSEPAVEVGEEELEQIARNNNARIARTGDLTPIVIGHTKDGAPETDQPPVVGYAANFRVAPWRQTRALVADFYIRRECAGVLDDYPRRSVELWTKRLEVDPISLLGATTPERDLGLLVRHQRGAYGHLTRYSRSHRPADERIVFPEASDPPMAMPTTTKKPEETVEGHRKLAAEQNTPAPDRAADAPANLGADEGGDDVMAKKLTDMTVGELLALLKQDSDICSAIELAKEVAAEDEGGAEGAGGQEPPLPDQEARLDHEPPPVHMAQPPGHPAQYAATAGGTSPGPMNTAIPSLTGPHKAHYQRRETPMPTPAEAETVRRYQKAFDDLAKMNAAQGQRIEALEGENRQVRRYQKVLDNLVQKRTDHHLDLTDDDLRDEAKRVCTVTKTDAEEGEYLDHMVRRYARNTPANNGHIPTLVPSVDGSALSSQQLAEITSLATERGITNWGMAKQEWKKTKGA